MGTVCGKRKARPDVVTKSSIMLGLGETDEEIQQAWPFIDFISLALLDVDLHFYNFYTSFGIWYYTTIILL